MELKWYRDGSQLAFNLYRKITSCNAVVNSFRNQIPKTNNHPLFHALSSPKCYVTYPICSAFQIRYGIQKDHRLSSPFINDMARIYYCTNYSTGGGNPRWVLNDLNTVLALFTVAVIIWFGSAITIDLYRRFQTVVAITIDIFRRIETVPFTNRSRLISRSLNFENRLGYLSLENRKRLYKGKTLPPTHPESVRVRLIAENIINSLHSVSGKEENKNVWIDVAYASDIPESVKNNSDMSLFERSKKDMDFVDVKWVQNCRKKGKWKRPTTNHLKAYNWEILLVKDCSDFVSAAALSGGKILVSADFLEYFTSDDEIAAIVGHEVAHILARHIAERRTTYTWVERTICFLFGLGIHNFHKTKKEFHAFFVEAEADYIGLLLMASAGYDPRVAPGVYKKLDEISVVDLSDRRRPGKKRARLLAKPKVMEEALLMYYDATNDVGIECFL